MALFSKEDIIKILNLTTEQSDLLTDKLGILGPDMDLKEFGKPIVKIPYIRNEFIDTLVNGFVYENHRAKLFTSIFDYFRTKRDTLAFGTYETYTDPIMPIDYDMTAFNRDLTFWETKTKVQAFAITRRHVFPQTITREVLELAFTSYDNFDNFLSNLLTAPRQGNTIIENNAGLELINKNLSSGAIRYKVLNQPLEASNKDYALEIAQDIQEAVYSMIKPTSDFNNYQAIAGSDTPVYAESDRNDIVFMGNAKSISILKTYVLAFAYNRDDIEFNFHFVPVGASFGYDEYNATTRKFEAHHDSPIQFIICDGGFMKLEDNLEEELSSERSTMTLGRQYALHVWQTMGIRLFRNAIAYVSAPPTEEVASVTPTTYTFNSANESEEFEIKDKNGKTLTDYTYSIEAFTQPADEFIVLTPTEIEQYITTSKTETGTLNVIANERPNIPKVDNATVTFIIKFNPTVAVAIAYEVPAAE